MELLRRITDTVLNIILAISAIILASSVVIYAFNSFLRTLKMAMPWPEEYCTYIVVIMIFLVQSKLEFCNEELTINALDSVANKTPWLDKLLYVIRYLFTIVAVAIIFYTCVTVAQQNFQYKAVTPVMNVSMGLYFSLVAFSFGLVILTCAVSLILRLGQRGRANG